MPDRSFEAVYGPWAPHVPADTLTLLDGLGAPWYVVGGWALEAYTGVSRAHEDVDLVVFRNAVPALRAHLDGRFHLWSLVSGSLRYLAPDVPDDDLPEGFFQLWLRAGAAAPWEYDVLVNPGDATAWVNRRMPDDVRPLADATFVVDGVRYLDPEIVLLFKATHARDKDRADLLATLPHLDGARRTWLRDAIGTTLPGHAWLADIGG